LSVIPIYDKLCPSCGGKAEADSIINYGMCRKCFIKNNDRYLNALGFIHSLELEVKKFEEFFKQATGGYRLWGSQKAWVKRLLRGENTSIIAPTGVGKTTLLITYALYTALTYSYKVLILTPTSSLAKQVFSRTMEMLSRINDHSLRIVFYDSTKNKQAREQVIQKIKNNEYDILIITNAFLSRNPGLFREKYFNVIIVDDVDSILNRSRNIIRLLNMLGLDNEAIMLAKKIIDLRSKAIVFKINGLEDFYHKVLKEYIELEIKLHKKLDKKKGQIIIASATGRARGPFIAIFRELLNLDVTGVTIYARDVTDTYMLIDNENTLIENIGKLVKILGKGGIILLSPFHPLRKKISQEHLISVIRDLGFIVEKATPRSIKRFLEGEIDLIVGSSTYYGVSVRGIDAPEKIKYIVFVGTPCFVTDLDSLLSSIKGLYRMLLFLKEIGIDVNKYIAEVSRILRYTTRKELRLLKDLLRGRIEPKIITNERVLEKYNVLSKIISEVKPLIKNYVMQKKLVRVGTIILQSLYENNVSCLIPDVMTYIQATGRASRLYNGMMTHGLSVIIEYKELIDLVRALEYRIKRYNKDIEIVDIENIDLDKEKKLIEHTRAGLGNKFELNFKSMLLVVESPTKAKTIASFYGKPSKRKIGNTTVYEIPVIKNNNILYLNVVATKGHIYDLVTTNTGIYGIEVEDNVLKPVFTTLKRCRICGHQFIEGEKCPKCGAAEIYDSIEIVNVLRKLASEVDEVLIATDPDIEGEKIAYDVYLTVKPFNDNVYRIELHEITIKEFEKAIKEKRKINSNLVNAQLYRRILDRVIGFSLSQNLWHKFNAQWLGAGRVQTPVLGWIIDAYKRWREYMGYKLRIIFGEKPYYVFTVYIRDKEEAYKLYELLKENAVLDIDVKTIKVVEDKPKPPYTTDELLYDAFRIGIPPVKTMKIAQELFESGLITYHRTDSTHVSQTGIEVAKRYLQNKGLLHYFTPRNWGSHGAHEAIRPTNPWDPTDVEKAFSEGLLNTPVYLTPLHIRVYDLIFRRFVASQMKSYKKIVYEAEVKLPLNIRLTIEVPVKVIEQGHNIITKPLIYEWFKRDQKAYPIREIKIVKASLHRLLDGGTVVKMMKERGIGRPSTYAKILKSIKSHGYVIVSKKRGYFIPTKIGMNVYEYLVSNYRDLVSEETTKQMEATIDLIIKGSINLYEAVHEVLSKLATFNLIDIDLHTARKSLIEINS